jgi:hypothetical protein
MRTLGCVAAAAALTMTAGCGGSHATASATPSGSNSSGSFTAYLACLRQHGANVPTAFPTNQPTNRPTARPSGGFRQGGGGYLAGDSAAAKACQSLRPKGGLGGGNSKGVQALQAYRSCLSSHGVTLPTPSPGASGRRGGFLGGLDTSNPKVQAAEKTCKPLLPTFRPRPASSG